jgi:hypothetical protein
MSKRFYFTVALVSLFLAGPLAAKNELPEVTEDGLHLQEQSRSGALYVRPEATLEHYNKIMLVDAYVAFKKDWQRDYNRTRTGLGMDIKDKDIERIKVDVANEFKKVFTETLEKGGYEVVTETGYDVMIVRPAIINLEIAAPDAQEAGDRGFGYRATRVTNRQALDQTHTVRANSLNK